MSQRDNSKTLQTAGDLQTWLQPLGRAIGHSRYVVLIAVIATLLVALSLFILGAVMGIMGVWHAWAGVLFGQLESPGVTARFLEIVVVMLEAVAFYLVAVGLYSLFIAPLNVTVALGIETLHDLEARVINVVIVILAVTLLEHFIRWEDPAEMLQYGATLALTVAALVLFQFYNRRAKLDEVPRGPAEGGSAEEQAEKKQRSKNQMFHHDKEEQEVKPTNPSA